MGLKRPALLFMVVSLSVALFVAISVGISRLDSAANFPVSPAELRVDHMVRTTCSASQQPCRLNLGSKHLSLSISPSGLPALEVLNLQLRVSGFGGNAPAQVWFQGRDMDMGLHYFSATTAPLMSETVATEEVDDGVLEKFQGMIPVCGIDRDMIWLLNVQYQHGGEVWRFVIELNAQHN